ncbi:ABC transporter substrate-binding protein [Comamonas granuli]|uniref:ABC transporter substrate-binding protein n=1 Tax=Comamonas granuli TaxID=290309 RepID=UPI0005A9CCC0|nr:ABC transporter substrate-binding protein [Comamonas granuli]
MHELSPPAALSRRRLLAGAALALPALAAPPAARAQEAALRLCQSTALTGPLGDLGSAMHQGAQAAFAAINARGGIHGRQIELQTLDDGYEVPRALANLDTFLAESDCFALFNCMGTPMVEAMLPKVKDSGIPFFAPFTGGQLSRIPGARQVFNIRASYAEEAAKCVQHLATLGMQRIAVVYQNNTFGQEVFEGARKAMEQAGLPAARTATVENNAADAAAAAQKMADANAEAVLVGLAGKPALEFIKAFRPLRPGVTPYALSVLGTTANVKALGSQAKGLVVSQVMPLPTNTIIPVVRDFQAAWKAAGQQAEPSHLALEGYINARVFSEALQRAGKNPTRAAFIDATWTLRKMDLGGFEINASVPERNASRFVELTLVNREGRFVR